MTLNELARKILRDADCDEYTYGGAESENIMTDITSVYEPKDLAPYTYVEVANEILSFSHPRPIERKPFRVLWETNGMCDAVEADSFEEAKSIMENTFCFWMEEEYASWKNTEPTAEDIERWNIMIYDCHQMVQKYDPNTDEYEDYWEFTDEELDSMGWKLMEPNE